MDETNSINIEQIMDEIREDIRRKGIVSDLPDFKKGKRPAEDAAEALLKLMESDYQMMGRYNRKKIYDFDISVVEREINNIYSKELDMLCK